MHALLQFLCQHGIHHAVLLDARLGPEGFGHDDEANTIAGLVIHEARMIPEVGQAFVFHGFRFEILKKRHHQITALRMSPVKREEVAE